MNQSEASVVTFSANRIAEMLLSLSSVIMRLISETGMTEGATAPVKTSSESLEIVAIKFR